jgi:glutamine synthetase adenylyltransferase
VQAHRLPVALSEQTALFRSLGTAAAVANLRELQRIMESASRLCALALRADTEEKSGDVAAPPVGLGSPGAEQLTRELVARSEVLAKALAADIGDPALSNLQRFLAAASTDEVRIRSTIGNVGWIERALPVFARSTLATGILARHPEDVGALFGGEDDKINGQKPSNKNPEQQMSDRLRIRSRHCILRSVGRSLLERTAMWEILREHSCSFDSILQDALQAVEAPEGFAVFAVGRLGTRELDVISDADLVFVRSTECDPETAEHCARNLVVMLSGYTREGSVIPVDSRLRPHGNAGELVSSTRKLAEYFEADAKAWETLAFSKLRFIAGSENLAQSVSDAVCSLQRRFGASDDFVPELRAMRKRLQDTAGCDSFKTGPGGLYDLDFVVGLLEARNALPAGGKQLCERLQALVERELLSPEQGRELLRATDLCRVVDHGVRVVEGRIRRWLPESDVLRAAVESVVGRLDLDEVLRSEMQRTRAVFNSIFGD